MTERATPTGLGVWVAGARPRTLGAAVVPVAVGTAAAGDATPWRTLGALAVALGLQVGVNYLNDFSDGMRGVDTSTRAGPLRLTASGLVPGKRVLLAGLVSFAVAGVAGVLLAAATSWWLLAVGGASMLAAYGYSGGPSPYGGRGLGEVFVFVFFGLVATAGTAWVQAETIRAEAWWASVPVGLLAVAILVANNLRDIPTDAAAGKRTLAVRLGDARTRTFFRLLLIVSLLEPVLAVTLGGLPAAALLSLTAAPLAAGPYREAKIAVGPELVRVLLTTAMLHLQFGGMLALGIWFGT